MRRVVSSINGNGQKILFGIFVTLLTGLFFYFLQGNATDHKELRTKDQVIQSRVDQLDPALKDQLKQIREQLDRIEKEQKDISLALARKGIK